MRTLFLLALACATACAQSNDPEPVRTAGGLVRGVREGDVVIYKGIPFAEPPVGDLRWRAPRAAPKWQGVLATREYKPQCMQVGPPLPTMPVEPVSEDCLYLNIWAPATPAKARLPVMVYLHGGAFRLGSPSTPLYWGHRLASTHQVITVNLAYRVGPLGFLVHPQLSAESEHAVSGNYGLYACTYVSRKLATSGSRCPMTDKHMTAVRNIAQQLERDGYHVLLEPGAAAIPFDLSGYQPDILATKGDERLLVEVKTTSTRRNLERYKSVADAVSQHPNWRFLLTTVPPEVEPDDAVAPPRADRAEIRTLLRRLDTLLDSDNHSFAIPYLWNALMAGLRTRAFEKSVTVDATSDLRVINYMYSLGEISNEDYETMRRYYEMRNSLTHSIGHSVPKEQALVFRDYVRRKLADWGVDVLDAAGA